jgi:glycerate-2-kinase
VAFENARELGYEVCLESNCIEGDYREIADKLILELAGLQNAFKKKVCLISGGEVSCPVIGHGIGGRNQEFALYAASQMAASGIEDAVVLSCGTDGIDGNSIAAGAVLSASAIRLAREKNLDLSRYYATSDTNSFFLEYGGLVVTGPTGNNIRDLRILLAL